MATKRSFPVRGKLLILVVRIPGNRGGARVKDIDQSARNDEKAVGGTQTAYSAVQQPLSILSRLMPTGRFSEASTLPREHYGGTAAEHPTLGLIWNGFSKQEF